MASLSSKCRPKVMTTDNGPLSFKQTEMFWHTKGNTKRNWLSLIFYWVCQNISKCLKTQQSTVKAIVYCFQNMAFCSVSYPGDFITKVKQVNSQSDIVSMSSFAVPSYLTIRSSVCIILIWDPCIHNLYNPCQSRSNYTLQKPHQCDLISRNK